MGRRTALLLIVSVVGLLLCGVGLGLQLLRAAEQALGLATTTRLQAIGLTTARALAAGADERMLLLLCRDHALEDAYVLDRLLRPQGGAGRRAMSLLRVDPDRAEQALRGQPSIGPAYSIEAPARGGGEPGDEAVDEPAPPPRGAQQPASRSEVLAGYFPVHSPVGDRVLVLEAGAAFTAGARRARLYAWAAAVASAALGLLCLLAVGLSVRAAQRERRLYGRAQRGQAISLMAAMVAHEIRNPLSTIRLGAELLREQAPNPDLVDDILGEVDRLNGLTTEFLALARDAPLRVQELDVAQLCDEICAEVRLRAQGVQVMRGGEASAEIHGDPDKLRQVLRNLTINAEQALAGSGQLSVEVQRASGGVTILIRDNGPGIDDQLSRRLFEPFATTKAGGTGLGLVLSRRIAERHGGALDIVPTPAGQRGACFALRLPLRPPFDAAEDHQRTSIERGRHDGPDPAM